MNLYHVIYTIYVYTRKQKCPDISTWTQAYRPHNLNIWIKFEVESEIEVANTQFLHLESNM